MLTPNTAYNRVMAKDVIHISEADAASDFASLMERVRAGAEVVIENDARPVAILHAADALRITDGDDPQDNIDVRKVEVTDEPLIGSKAFFAGCTLEQLAEAQGVPPLERPGDLAGGWPADESIDEFMAATYQSRS